MNLPKANPQSSADAVTTNAEIGHGALNELFNLGVPEDLGASGSKEDAQPGAAAAETATTVPSATGDSGSPGIGSPPGETSTPAVIVHDADAMLREARAALTRGWAMVPLTGKKAAMKDWQKGPAASIGDVERWARVRNIGVRTGKASGFIVIDDDTDDRSAATTLDLPPTVTAVTGGGGRHYYFKAPPIELRNSVGRLAPKVDVRADGGYIVLPGSTHPDTGELYRWLEGRDPESIAMAPFPVALMDILRPMRTRPKVTAQEQLEQRARAMLRDLCAGVQQSAEGTRNDTLNRAAFTAGGLVAVGALDRVHASSELREAGLAAGLDAKEVDATLESGIRAGHAEPFNRTELLASAGIVLQDSESERPDVPRDGSGRAEILLLGGELPKIVAVCQDVLLNLPEPIVFRRGGTLVRLLRSDPVTMREVQDATPGRFQTVDVTQDWLRLVLTDVAAFYRLGRKDNEFYAVDCPPAVAKALLENSGSWAFPSLLAIATSPTLRADGSVLEVPGYDPKTTVFLDTGGIVFPRIASEPTRADALAALADLKYVLKDFPFETPADRSVILAAKLTALVRPSLRAAPMFGISAPKMASGKSLLADIVSLFATGRVGQAMPQGKDEEEDRKRLLAILKEGEAVAVIDNVERPLGGGPLCAALTQEVYSDRMLGSTRMVALPTCITWIATGNNLVVEGDLTTRVLISRLDPGIERPEERKFEFDPRRYVLANRGALVVAGLTVLRAYFVAGRPKQDLAQFGRFEDFSDLVRSALVWLGEADPCEVRKRIEDADPDRQLHAELMFVWLEIFGPESLTAAQVVLAAEQGAGGVELVAKLRELLGEVAAGPRGTISAHRLGMWLGRKRERIEGGMRIMHVGHRHRSSLWAVVAPDGTDRRHRFGAGADKPPQPRRPHPSDLDQRVAAPFGGEGGGAGGAVSASSPIEVRPSPRDGGHVYRSSESSTIADPEVAASVDDSFRTAIRPSWPSTRCYRCDSRAFWRLRNDGLGLPGESRCERCYPVHPPEHLIERFDAAEVRP